jgi:hypothetical protein
LGDGTLSHDLIDHRILAVKALKESVSGDDHLGQSFGMDDVGLRPFHDEGHEVAPLDLEDVNDEAFESRPVRDGHAAPDSHRRSIYYDSQAHVQRDCSADFVRLLGRQLRRL